MTITGLSGGAVTVSSVTTSGTTTTATLSRTVASTETGGTLYGVAGSFTDSASPPNPCMAFSIALSNQSTPAPTNLTATGGLTQVKLAWTGIAGSATYSVYRATASGAETLLQSGVSGTSYTDAGLTGGTYYYKVSATLAGSESTLSNEASAAAADFTLSANPTAISVPQGGAATSAITVNPLGGFSGTVSLTGTSTVSGITVTTTSASPGASVSLPIAAAKSVPAGTYTLTVTGTDSTGTVSRKATISLTVTPAHDFSLSASPTTVTLPPSGSGSTIVTVAGLNGFTGIVSLSASGQPSGVTPTFAPSSVQATGTSTLTFAASQSAAPGSYPITITGTYNGETQTTSLTLNVTDFSLSANPSSLTMSPGGSVSTSIALTPLYGFTGSAALTVAASSLPSGMTASFSPASVSAGSPGTLTLTASSAVALNTYSISVTGTANGVVRTATITATVSPVPQPTVTIGQLSSPSIGQTNAVYAGIPCTATASATISSPPGYNSSYTAAWSYSTVYIVYSTTGNDETWGATSDGTSAAVTLNGAANNPAGTFNATFKTAGYYEVCISATVTFTSATGPTLGPFTGYGFATTGGYSSPGTGSSSSNVALSAPQQAAAAPAGTPTTPGEPDLKALPASVTVTINGTGDSADDKYVRLKSSHPTGLFYAIPAKVLNTSPINVTVKISCTNSKLGFFWSSATANNIVNIVPTDSATISIVVPAGSFGYFYITGENISSQIKDTEVDVSDANSGVSYEKCPMTVFGFTSSQNPPQMTTTKGGTYSISSATMPSGLTGPAFFAVPFPAMALSAQATLAPTGINYAAPQIKNLKLSFVQNGYSFSPGFTFAKPTVTWGAISNQGLPSVVVYTTYSGTGTFQTQQALDCQPTSTIPFYDSSSTGLVPIVSASTQCSSGDDPVVAVPAWAPPANDQFGNSTPVTYQATQATLTTSFKDWCTIYDSSLPAGSQDEWLCEASWTTNINWPSGNLTATPGTQSSVSFTDTPIEKPPLCNTIIHGQEIPLTAGPVQKRITFPATQ